MTTVLVTRPAHQAEPLCALLEQQGFTVLRLPLLEIQAMTISEDGVLDKPIDWMIFISANAVRYALMANEGKIRAVCGQARVAAVGCATANALQQMGIVVNSQPAQDFNSEALLALPELQTLQDQRCMIVRGVGGRELLADTLRERGAQLDYLEVYRRVVPVNDPTVLVDALKQGVLDVITITSAEILQNLLALLPSSDEQQLLYACPLVVISDRLKLIAQDLGFKTVTVSNGASDRAVFKTIVALS